MSPFSMQHCLIESITIIQDKAGMAKPIEVKLRPKGQALGFGVRHRDDEWDDEKASRATAKVRC